MKIGIILDEEELSRNDRIHEKLEKIERNLSPNQIIEAMAVVTKGTPFEKEPLLTAISIITTDLLNELFPIEDMCKKLVEEDLKGE